MNNHAQIVGSSDGGYFGADAHAVLYENGTLFNLNDLIAPDLGWTLNQAYDINDNGQIAGYGRNSQGYEHAYLLTPVPEPATFALISFGTAIFARKRRK